MCYVDRTSTELAADRDVGGSARSGPLGDFRDESAYVLLGDPGAGKTTEFERECEALADAAVFVSARDFTTFEVASRPEWQNRTLFIDGLDEMRAGAADARSPLDAIRDRLDQLGRPKFRLACREADWLGRSDQGALEAVASDGRVSVLRLEPLSLDEAEELLNQTGRVQDAASFRHETRQHGIDSMLQNPLTLALLAAAVGRDGWPDGRLELFESACRQLVSEWNEERRVVARGAGTAPARYDPGTLMDAASYLCAVLLLTGHDGFTLGSPAPAVSFEAEAQASAIISLFDLSEVPGGASQETMRAALATGLFRAEGGEAGARVDPLHRQVAEFLAGRHLARRIDDGLPARRVVSLMLSPADSRVVTPLRGLAAWLAAHSAQVRPRLIEADPVGAALYGDIRQFADEDRRRLLSELDALPAQEPVFDYERPEYSGGTSRADVGWAFRALARAEMVEPIKDLLSRRGPQAPNERIESLILGALSDAEEPQQGSLRVLLPELAERVRDDARPAVIREVALNAYRHILDGGDRGEALRALLEAIHEGTVSDPDDNLRGMLLDALYPDTIGPPEVWRYLTPRRDRFYYGRCWLFWARHLLEVSSEDQAAELLDALDAAVRTRLLPVSDFDFWDIYSGLLARGLRSSGDEIGTERLYRWLSIPITGGLHFEQQVVSQDALDVVRSWLEARPEEQKAIILARLEDRVSHGGADAHRWRDFQVLHGSRPPADFGLWCLEQAIEHARSALALSEELLGYAHSSLQDPALNEGLTPEGMRVAVREHDHLARRLEELLEPRPSGEADFLDSHRRQIEKAREQRDSEARRRQQEWAEMVLAHEREVRENRCPPRSLHQMSKAYLGLFSDSRDIKSPEGRLLDFLGGDSRAVGVALSGLRNAVLRDDLPEVDQTTSWHLEERQPSLASPVLASLQFLDGEDPDLLDGLDAEAKRRVLAMYCWSPATVRISASWYRRWLRQDPDLVLDVLQDCALAAIRNGAELPDRLRALTPLDREEDCPRVDAASLAHGISPDSVGGDEAAAHRLRLRVLRAFPTRAPEDQLPLLDGLVFDALNGPDTGPVKDLARRKLKSTSLTVGQRVRWLTVDAVLSGAAGLGELKEFVEQGEIRARHLAAFLNRTSEWARFESENRRSVASMLNGERDPATLGALIEMLGSYFPPEEWGSGAVSLGQEVSDRVAGLIAELGSIAGDETGQALAQLIGDYRLTAWRHHLNRAQMRHRVVDRDAAYRQPTIEQVQAALDGGAPANAADLHALLTEHLADAHATIRGADSNLWRQFWNEDGYGRPENPKPEESCRDALLAYLRPRLPSGVELQPEGRCAAETRVDIRASCAGFNVPIEVKKNGHRDLWRAVRSQLIEKYTADPATSGYGIYLVLWFGADETTRPPEGGRPATPEDLQHGLERILTADEARKVSVIVLDVTKPFGQPSGWHRGRSG